jgi:hypothetical protein
MTERTIRRKMCNLFWAAIIEHYMETFDICKYIYRKILIEKELPKNHRGGCSYFNMCIDASGTDWYVTVDYYDWTDKRYKLGVRIQKEYIIPVEKDDAELYKYIKRRGPINAMCGESIIKTDAEITVTYFDNIFTRRCREEKIKFRAYSEYRHWRKAYKEFLCDTTKKYDHPFLKKFTK